MKSTSTGSQRQRYFSNTLHALLKNLSDTGRGRKQTFSVVIDASMSAFALWLAYTLRFGEAFHYFSYSWHLFVLVPLATVTIFGSLGIYRWVVRSTNSRLYRQLLKGCLMSALVFIVLTFLAPPFRDNARSLFAIYGVLLVLGVVGSRIVWAGLFDAGARGEPIAIYGAGAYGRQLADLLGAGVAYRPVAFVDDDPSLGGSTISGLRVLDGREPDLRGQLRRLDVGRVVLAMPSISNRDYQSKLTALEKLGLPVQTMPDIAELVTGAARADDIRDISIKDILGRTEVAPDPELIGRRVSGRTVLVTGGGGSIGSELCRQIAKLSPKRLIVLDSCEANLYHITEELGREEVPFAPRLGSVTDRPRLERLMSEFEIDTVYHAAAYKHVPIVEAQPGQGVETNVFGTLALLETAIAHRVDDFVLISTDKAVRPTNAMGASKRTAELILQAKAHAGATTRISMVRFGNVLGSSGSVVPKFKKQIESGGPITVTDPNITRYFMTIPEAAQLVLQASAIAHGGDVFVLDMGDPVKIVDLAKTMVRLYGKRLAEESGDPADIDIAFEGLRPGEKMYEELFINDSDVETEVRKVFSADEVWLPWAELKSKLDAMAAHIADGDDEALREVLMPLSLAGRHDLDPDAPIPPAGELPSGKFADDKTERDDYALVY